MAKIKKDPIRDKAVDQIITAWDQCEKQFSAAIKANEKARGQVVFAVNIDKSDTPPSVVTKISFKDTETEGDMKVSKTFSKVIGGKLEDDDQETLPLDNDGAPPSKRLFDADKPEKKKKADKKPEAKKEAPKRSHKKKVKEPDVVPQQETQTITE